MDTGEGTFRPLTEAEISELKAGELQHVFTVGEILRVKDSLFRVKAIKAKELRLKLLPSQQKPTG
jgi:uncharacterized Zn finger protein